MLDRLRDGEIGHAGFDHGDAVREIDLADAVEFGHAEKHAVGERQRAARQRRAGPARHDLDALGVTEGEHPAHLLSGLGQDYHHGQLPIRGQPIGLVGTHLPFSGDHPLAGHDGAQRSDDAFAAREHSLIWRGHGERHVGSLVTRRWGPMASLFLRRLYSGNAA